MRLKNAVLAKGSSYGGKHSTSLSLANGGQYGYMPRIGKVTDGKFWDVWVSSQAHVSQNIIAVVIDYPRFFDLVEDKDELIAAYKAIIEEHPQKISGLEKSLTVEFNERAVEGIGAYSDILKVSKAPSNPSFEYSEILGRGISKFIEHLITWGYMEPETGVPRIREIPNIMEKLGGSYTADWFTGKILYFEPDILHKQVVLAWLQVGALFSGNGSVTGSRDKQSPGEVPVHTIEQKGAVMSNTPVETFAQSILNKMTILNRNATEDMLPSADAVAASLEKQDVGFNAY